MAGVNLVGILVPDVQGVTADVTLGFDSVDRYYKNYSFFGAVIGPCANRTAGAAYTLDGVDYRMDQNDGPNNLHTHIELGFHKRIWDAVPGENSVTFSLEDEDGYLGFPGHKKVSVTYSLDEENALRLHYHASSDKRTIFNLTNHSYFNRDIEADFEQLKLTGGYDHNFCIDDWDGSLKHIATAKGPKSGRVMKVYTTLPGVQFYAGNFIAPEEGKAGTGRGQSRCSL
mgnify:CR=1 FL=1